MDIWLQRWPLKHLVSTIPTGQLPLRLLTHVIYATHSLSQGDAMIVYGSAELARQRRRALKFEDLPFHKSEWMETTQDPVLSPTIFLVEQPPNTTLRTHFHTENEFQVVVQGFGTIARHEIRPITVHYAGAYTGYGPLVAGPEGISYFTIRGVFEAGAKTAVADMVRGPKRHCLSEPAPPLDAPALRSLSSVQTVDLIELQPDGVAARTIRIPPGGRASAGLDPSTGGGQFYVVVAGELSHGDVSLSLWEPFFVSSTEAQPLLTAGDAGAEVLCLQLAPKDPAYVR